MNAPPGRAWFFVLFAASGFSGLIYESIWSQYLKLFLGHAAYAQGLVLAILMGGMALGAWLCGLAMGRWRRLVLGYAVVEGVIGLLALGFHPAFVAITGYALDTAVPALGHATLAAACQWTLAAVLILPQSLLLGMTFPLMSAGVLRAHPERGGETIAMLYFTNSLGAAAGVLASGFLLVGWLGLPGTAAAAGAANLGLALVAWRLGRRLPEGAAPAAVLRPVDTPSSRAAPGSGLRLLLGVALFTGAASFMYEIAWIRMLSMVLGASTQAFELMLSAFLLGLAFGGLWIRRRIDAFASPERALGWVQVAMGLLALATLPVYGHTFEVMHWLLNALGRTPQGYFAFNLGSHAIAMLVMFPAAFCAGMTLPLITHVLLRRGAGEAAIGRVYAANTLGAIVGVVFAMNALPLLGVKGVVLAGAALDVGLGLALLSGPMLRAASVAAAGLFAGALFLVEIDPLKMASGVFREGRILRPGEAEVLQVRHGKTATVALLRDGTRLSLATNGKSDALMDVSPEGPIADDEPVMVMLGALPIALHPEARRAAVIGFGSGLTTHVLLSSDRLQVVDSVEIEPEMVRAARGFLPHNAAAFEDPRSRIHIEDAKTFFALRGGRYDLIVSEPSNPWVSGVASLFSEEFYARARRHLAPGGLLVQWLQLYEIEPALVASVMKALASQFTHYEIYAPDGSNLIIVARDGAPVPRPSAEAFAQPRLTGVLSRLRVRNAEDLDGFHVGGRAALQPLFDAFEVRANSDYTPVLDQGAPRARFMKAHAAPLVELASLPLPAAEFLGAVPRRSHVALPRPWFQRSTAAFIAQRHAAYLETGDAQNLAVLPAPVRGPLQLLRHATFDCPATPVRLAPAQLHAVAAAMLPYLARGEGAGAWRRLAGARCLDPGLAPWIALYLAVDGRDAVAMATAAETLLRSSDRGPESNAAFLLAAAVTGRLAAGEAAVAQRLWSDHEALVHGMPPVLLEFLAAHLASSGAARAGPPPQPR